MISGKSIFDGISKNINNMDSATIDAFAVNESVVGGAWNLHHVQLLIA